MDVIHGNIKKQVHCIIYAQPHPVFVEVCAITRTSPGLLAWLEVDSGGNIASQRIWFVKMDRIHIEATLET